MNKKPKILILVKRIDGGTGTFVSKLLKLKNYFDFSVCVLEKQKYREIKYRKFHYFKENFSYKDYYNLNPFLMLHIVKELLWLNKKIKDLKPKVIIGIDIHCNSLLGIISLFLNKEFKSIFTNHINLRAVLSRKLSKTLTKPLIFVCRHLYNRADVLVGVSAGVSEDIADFFSLRRKVITIQYGLDTEITKRKLSEIKKIEESRKVISIGRFEPQKDFATLIKAFAIVRKKIGSAKLLLLGDGEQRQELAKLVKDLRIGSSVSFLGWKQNVYKYLSESQVFVLSSNYEGFGYVLVEAMACGIPIVATDSPFGPREVLDNGRYGKLIPIGDISKMSNAIIGVLNSKEEYKKYSSLSKYRIKFFREDKMLWAYKNLLLDLIRKA